MKKILNLLKPFVPAMIMLVIIIVSLILVFSFDVNIKGNLISDPQKVYIRNKANRDRMLILSIILEMIVLLFYLFEVKFRKTIVKWILFNVSIFMMIAASIMLFVALSYTTCFNNLFLVIGMPFLNFFLFITSFVFACNFLKQKKNLEKNQIKKK